MMATSQYSIGCCCWRWMLRLSDERDELFELDGVDALESVSGSISESLRIVSLGERMGERVVAMEAGCFGGLGVGVLGLRAGAGVIGVKVLMLEGALT